MASIRFGPRIAAGRWSGYATRARPRPTGQQSRCRNRPICDIRQGRAGKKRRARGGVAAQGGAGRSPHRGGGAAWVAGRSPHRGSALSAQHKTPTHRVPTRPVRDVRGRLLALGGSGLRAGDAADDLSLIHI